MKIAINCSYYMAKSGGIKEYIYNLLINLAKTDDKNEYVIYVSNDQYMYAKETLPDYFRIKKTPFSTKHPIFRALFENKFYQQEENLEKFDVFHSPFFHLPKLKCSKTVITVHDLRLYRYPMTYKIIRYIFLQYKVKKSVLRSDRIISISEFTKQELKKLCNVDVDKVSVIHEAINEKFFNNSNIDNYIHKLPDGIKSKQFLLTVGHIEPRKNHINLIKAFNKIDNKNIKLVIVGKRNHGYKRVMDMIKQNKDIYYLDFVEPYSLLWLYENAKIFVFPSFYEGFGFPPLEAASLGTVSLVSNVASMPEVCGDSAYYFNPFDVDELIYTLNLLLSNEKKLDEKRKMLKTNLKRFSWENNATETLELYKSMLHLSSDMSTMT